MSLLCSIMLNAWPTYYALNYAGIIGTGLVTEGNHYHVLLSLLIIDSTAGNENMSTFNSYMGKRCLMNTRVSILLESSSLEIIIQHFMWSSKL